MALYHRPLEEQLFILEQLIVQASASLSVKPPGHLTIQKCGPYPQYFYRSAPGEKRQYIRKNNSSFAQILAQKEYEEAFMKIALQQKEELLRLLSQEGTRSASVLYHALADPFEILSDERKSLIHPYVLPDDLFVQSFLQTSYERLGFAPDAPLLLTENGERVRSKTEKIMADYVKNAKIAYLYELPQKLSRIGIVHPDLTLLDLQERVTVLVEHFGMMQDPVYAAKAMTKMECYIHDGFFPGERLLTTFEGGNHVFDLQAFKTLIHHRFSV